MLKQDGATPPARFGVCHSKTIRYHLNVVFQFVLEYYFFGVIEMNFDKTGLSFLMVPSSRHVYEYSIDEFMVFWGSIRNIVLDNLKNTGKSFENFPIYGPTSIVIGRTSKSLVFGLETRKSVSGALQLITIKSTLPNEINLKAVEQDVCKVRFGVDTKLLFFSVSKDTWETLHPFCTEQSKKDEDFTYSNADIMNWCMKKALNDDGRPTMALASLISVAGVLINEERKQRTVEMNPIFRAKNLVVDKNQVFCVLPFSQDRLEIFDEVLKPYLEQQHHFTVIRSGKVTSANQNIMETIWTYINTAGFVLADISDANPNVFYELGICHTVGKKVVMICDDESYKKDYNSKLPLTLLE